MNNEQLRKEFESMYSVGDRIVDSHSLAMREDGEYEQALARMCFKWFSRGYQVAARERDELIGKLLIAMDKQWLNENRRGMILKYEGDDLKRFSKIIADDDDFIRNVKAEAKGYGE